MGIINVLEESVANLIAAGEVVERPASVIKELVENSLDAGAKNITIEIKNGGMSYMRVTDDGAGIEPDDVGVAFLRHATSKIKNREDLSKIGTLGFRGEALCSIAAVSNVSLVTKTKNAPMATKVVVEGGVMEDVLNVGAPNGTTIEVKKLFYNTPARMKFLKKDATEAGYVSDVVEKFILANPGVSFKFINNAKQVLFSSGDNDLVSAIYSVYGRDYAKSVIAVNYESENMSVSGYIGKSNISRPNRAYQSFFVNGRSIKSLIMTKALEEAYKNQVMIGKFPFAVLDLKVDCRALDVNVHPHKTEVKFSDEKQVFETVYWGVKNALYEKPIIPAVEFKEKKPFTYPCEKESTQKSISIEEFEKKPSFVPKREEKPTQSEIKIYENEVLKPMAEARENVLKTPEKVNLNTSFETLVLNEPDINETKNDEVKEKTDFSKLFEEVGGVNIAPLKEEVKDEPLKEESEEKKEEYKICGSVFNTYIIVQQAEKMLLIDQHAAHERLKFEEIKENLKEGGVASQRLISAQPVSLSATEFEFATENKDMLFSLGFDFEQVGYRQVMINAVPYALSEFSPEDVFVEILGEVMDNKKQIISASYERALYTVACKAAIKANKPLSASEMDELVKKVFEMKNINTCPHGRPIIISFTKTEIEKQFKRIV